MVQIHYLHERNFTFLIEVNVMNGVFFFNTPETIDQEYKLGYAKVTHIIILSADSVQRVAASVSLSLLFILYYQFILLLFKYWQAKRKIFRQTTIIYAYKLSHRHTILKNVKRKLCRYYYINIVLLPSLQSGN